MSKIGLNQLGGRPVSDTPRPMPKLASPRCWNPTEQKHIALPAKSAARSTQCASCEMSSFEDAKQHRATMPLLDPTSPQRQTYFSHIGIYGPVGAEGSSDGLGVVA